MAHDTPVEFGIHGCDEITYRARAGRLPHRDQFGRLGERHPDWQTTNWDTSQGGRTFWKNLAMPESMMEAFPAITGDGAEGAAEGLRSTGLFAEK